MEGQNVDAVGIAQGGGDGPDLAHAGQEHEHIPRVAGQGAAHRTGHARSQAAPGRQGRPPDLDGEGTPGAGDDGGPAEEGCDGPGGDGRRHGHHPQVGPEHFAGVEGEGQTQIGLQVPLVELVEDDHPHARQGRVGLQAAGQYPLGHDLDPSGLARAPFISRRVADRPADVLAQKSRHASGGGACRHPPGFQDDDPSVPQPILVEQTQRDHRRLAGTGLGRQHRCASTQGRPQLRHDVLHRQSGGGKSLARAGHPTHATGRWRATILQLTRDCPDSP